MEYAIIAVVALLALYLFVWPIVAAAMLAFLGIKSRSTGRKIDRVIRGRK